MKKEHLLVAAVPPIAFHAELARLFGIGGALYVQQLYYWSDKGSRDDGFIYKTKEDIELETTLTVRKQDKIRKQLEANGFLETKLLKAPTNAAPTLHYRLNIAAINAELAARRADCAEPPKGNNGLLPNVTTDYDKKSESLYTETTPETTTRNIKASKLALRRGGSKSKKSCLNGQNETSEKSQNDNCEQKDLQQQPNPNIDSRTAEKYPLKPHQTAQDASLAQNSITKHPAAENATQSLSRANSENEPTDNRNEMVERAFDIWEQMLGYAINRGDRKNRQAAYNIMRAKNKGEDWLRGMLRGLVLAREDRYSGVKISNFVELQYGWERLLEWGHRRRLQSDTQTVGAGATTALVVGGSAASAELAKADPNSPLYDPLSDAAALGA